MRSLPSVKTDAKYQERLVEIHSEEDIPPSWRDTPIEALVMAQNFGWPILLSGSPKVLIASCIEFRYTPPVPRMFAYVIRRASGRLIGSEFSIGYVLSKGIKHIMLVGHNDCGMVHVDVAAPKVVDALVEQGWGRDMSQRFVEHYVHRHSITDELEALEVEYRRLTKLFPKITVAPLFVSLYDSKFYLPKFFLSDADNSGKQCASYTVPDDEIQKLMT